MQGVRNNDFEDIAISSGHNGYFIYVGDIGNDWPNHCQGINQTQRMVHKITEPNSNQYEYLYFSNLWCLQTLITNKYSLYDLCT